MRSQLGERAVTLVAATGYGRQEGRDKALAAGFDEHFVKPVDRSKLAQLLAKL